jgi:hypothetical protein
MGNDPYILMDLRGAVDDIFYNSFDRTWAKVAPGESDPPRVWTKLPIESAEDDGTVVYNYNNEFFRSEDFTAEEKLGKHILFAGCSQTEGVGAPLETVWSKVLLNSLDPNLGFYSIAKSGFGWQKVITSFMVYVDKYGAPDYLFILLPNLGRFFEWEDSTSSFRYVQRYPNGGSVISKQDSDDNTPVGVFVEKPFSKEEHKRSFIDFSISWKLFERYCESVGTKMLWSSWDYNENNNYELANISNNYISLNEDGLMSYIASNRPDGKMKQFDISRRDGHAGVIINEYWADEFRKEIGKRGWLNA